MKACHNYREQSWHSGIMLDCRSTGEAIDPTPGAWFIPKFILLAQVIPGPVLALYCAYCGLKHHSFIHSFIIIHSLYDCSNMVLRQLAPQLHIPYSITFQPEDIPIVPTTYGTMWVLVGRTQQPPLSHAHPHLVSLEVTGPNCISKWLVVKPFCLLTDDPVYYIPIWWIFMKLKMYG